MNKFIALSIFLIISSCFAFEKEDGVLVLTDSDIDDAVAQHEHILVEFYAPWCGHCKSLAPEYVKAAASLEKQGSSVVLAKVDATENPESAQANGVSGYPTLKFFIGGKATDYTGGRDAAGIVSWLNKKTGPPCKVLETKDDFESFKESSDVVVVVYAAADSEEFKKVENFARASDDALFAVVHNADAGFHEVTAPAVVLYKNFDEGRAVYSGDFDDKSLTEFVGGNSVPLVSTFSPETAPKIFGSGIDTHFLYFNDATHSSHESTMEELRKVAVDFKGKTLFVFVPASEDRVLGFFDLTAADLPAGVLVSMGEGDMQKFGFDKELTSDNIKSHVEAFHNGELKPTLKSEEIPEDNTGPVKVVVGHNFEQLVLDDSKDVLLEFYAPWCGHCKSLAPTYEKLGEHFAGFDSVVIAKVDATANDIVHPAVSVKGFPTILFFPAGAKNTPMTYEGDRDLDGFVAFIEKNAAKPLEKKAHEDL